MMVKKRVIHSSLSMVMVAALSACSSGKSSVFEPSLAVPIKVEASEDINIFEDDLPRPIVIRVYQLKELGTFQNADFISLYESDSTVLANALIDSKTLSPVLPGEQRDMTLDVQQQTRFIAVFAEFANYQVATSKATVALVAEPEENPIIIRISHSKIEVSQPVDRSWW